MPRITGGVVAVGVCVVAAVAAFATSRADEPQTVLNAGRIAKTSPVWRLEPRSMGALRDPALAVSGVPAQTRILGEGRSPVPGTVRQVGPKGVALAWIADGQVCAVQDFGGGCIGTLDAPISVTRGDPDAIGQRRPAYVLGFAHDAVRSVRVELRGGTSITSQPVGNFYFVELPTSSYPWDVAAVSALMLGGGRYTERLSTKNPLSG